MNMESLAGIDEKTAINNGIPIVGYMIAFTMGECLIPNEKVEEFWEENELPSTYKPNPTREKGAFKKVCSSIDGYKEKEFEIKGKKAYSVFTSTKLGDTVYMITRKILIIDDNEKESELEHENLMKVYYDKERKKIDYFLEDSRYGKVAKELFENTILPKYGIYLKNMTRENIHDAFKRFLRIHNAVPLTIGKGGAWFIPSGSEEELEKVKRFYNEVADKHRTGDYRIQIRTIPMIDTLDVKAMVEEGVQKKLEQEMKSLIKQTLAKLEHATEEEKVKEILGWATERKEDVMRIKTVYERVLKKRIEEPKITDIPTGKRMKIVMERFGVVE